MRRDRRLTLDNIEQAEANLAQARAWEPLTPLGRRLKASNIGQLERWLRWAHERSELSCYSETDETPSSGDPHGA